MKRLVLTLLVTLLLVFSVSMVVFAQNTIKAGIDPYGTVSIDNWEYDVNMGVSLGWEYTEPISDTVSVGAGIEYQLTRKAEGASSGFSYIPFYAVVKLGLQNKKINYDINPYLTGKIGYDLFYPENLPHGVNSGGGPYFAIGGGVKLKENCELEATYSWYNGSIYNDYESIPFDYSKLGISVGYTF